MKVALQRNPFNRRDLLEERGFEVVEGVCRNEDDLADLLSDADGALIGVMPLTSRFVLERCPKLKVVSRLGVGVDSIDLDAATELGILATNVPGSNTTEVADHAMALMLALTRCVVDAAGTSREGRWGHRESMLGLLTRARRIAGHTVGIIGFGNIGRAFATRIRGFGPARIIAADPYVDQVAADLYGVRIVPLEELLAEADYVTIHCSMTEETRHLINRDTLALMKPTALLVNAARGKIIDGRGPGRSARRRHDRGRRARRHREGTDRPGGSAAQAAQLHRDPAHRRLLARVPERVPDPPGRERDPGAHGADAPRHSEPGGNQDDRRHAGDGPGTLGGSSRLLDRAGVVAGWTSRRTNRAHRGLPLRSARRRKLRHHSL